MSAPEESAQPTAAPQVRLDMQGDAAVPTTERTADEAFPLPGLMMDGAVLDTIHAAVWKVTGHTMLTVCDLRQSCWLWCFHTR